VHRFLQARLGEGPAEDLAAETFVVAFRRRSDYDGNRSDARPWLLGIALNLAREYERSQGRRGRALARLPAERSVDPYNGAVDRLDAAAARKQLADALNRLTSDERDLVVLYATQELTYGEIAEFLSIPPGTVRSRLHRVRAKLRTSLERGGAEESAIGGNR
jgi:RNA polymerase sigma factor (sigma-70 family)